MANEDLLKIRVDLPEGDLGVFSEGLWAKPLGNDLYEVQNSPWYSREINYLDVVRAVAVIEDERPEFVAVERRSGHRTIQVILLESGKGKRDEILSSLSSLGATWEGAYNKLFALDFAPAVDWSSAMNYLESLTEDKSLEYRYSAY